MNFFICIIACLRLLGQASAEEPKPENPVQQTILFLGDSITAAGSYVRLIGEALTKVSSSTSWRVVNAGCRSETVADLTPTTTPSWPVTPNGY